MNAAAQNPLDAPAFEIPNPPDEFGQDGGKFYRCYDTLAQEIDDDMTSGLKEQLDGILIFAGIFAAVNTAFLALTIPLLSADPADDANALLAQNNAILMQLVMRRNDTTTTDFTLPSAAFSPSYNIFIINALFSLSLAFAIISSFLAVLGRQWLVYYRKRGGGGPDRQRWEQLKRFLGAERWRLEAILDDVLPSLLQIGLINFCISLILYLHHLSPRISVIVGIPLFVGLAVFIGSALCTVWDRFCPFHSPLSHLLLWGSHSLSWVGVIMNRNLPFKDTFLHGISFKREEESLESLQAIALQRAICVSDDPATLLHATANIFSIRNPAAVRQLEDDSAFQERFSQLIQNPSNGMSQLRGYNVDPKGFAESARRLYYSAAAHITFTTDSRWNSWFGLLVQVPTSDITAILIPSPLLQNSSPPLIRGNLGFCILWWEGRYWFRNSSSNELDVVRLRNHLTACSEALASCSDLRFLALFAWIVFRFPERIIDQDRDLLDEMRQPYRGNAVNTIEFVRGAFKTLLPLKPAGPWGSLARDTWSTNILRCVEQIVADEQGYPNASIDHKFKLLEICEAVLRNPQLPEAAGQVGRKLRINVAYVWSREYINWAYDRGPADHLVDPLRSYIANIRNLDQSELGYHENIAVVLVFGPMLRRILAERSGSRVHAELAPICEMFNTFVSDVHKASRQFQNNSRRARDPDERWCHWKKEPLSIEPVSIPFYPEDILLLLLSSPTALQNRRVS